MPQQFDLITEDVLQKIKKESRQYVRYGLEADDAEGYSLLYLCQAAATYENSRNIPFLAWARTYIKWQHINRFRLAKKTRSKAPEPFCFQELREDHLVNYDTEDEILTALSAESFPKLLTKREAQCLELSELGGVEAGKILHITRHTVSAHRSNAKTKLKQLLAA